jgi:hypothetical protein
MPEPEPDPASEPPTNIRLPNGVTPEDFPGMDFEQQQPDPTTPGGRNRNAPPVPNDSSNILVPFMDDDGDIFFFEFEDLDVPLGEWWEFDDLDVPLGKWYWDDDEEFWIFDEDVPLGDWGWVDDMPVTGSVPLHFYMLPIGLISIGMGLLGLILDKLRTRRRIV